MSRPTALAAAVPSSSQGRGEAGQQIGAHVLDEMDDACRLTVSIEVTGWGAGLFGLLFGAAIRRAIARENEGFRKTAEQLAGNATAGER